MGNWTVTLLKGRPISKPYEVLAPEGLYHVTKAEAQQLTSTNQAKWIGAKRLLRLPDESKRSHWKAVGYSAVYSERTGLGPKFCNLQMV
jgi:hypothetical protein